jgi:hypothetical protein
MMVKSYVYAPCLILTLSQRKKGYRLGP